MRKLWHMVLAHVVIDSRTLSITVLCSQVPRTRLVKHISHQLVSFLNMWGAQIFSLTLESRTQRSLILCSWSRNTLTSQTLQLKQSASPDCYQQVVNQFTSRNSERSDTQLPSAISVLTVYIFLSPLTDNSKCSLCVPGRWNSTFLFQQTRLS